MEKIPVKSTEILCSKEFKTRIESGISCIKFHSPTCGHCVALGDQVLGLFLKNNKAHGIKFLEVDVYSNDFKTIKSMINIDIQTIPHTILIYDGKILASSPGTKPELIYKDFSREISNLKVNKTC